MVLGKNKIGGRGQAAVEFLTTYGWALIVIVIVLVVLGWLGIFAPQSRVADTCTFQQGIECNEIRIGGTPFSGTKAIVHLDSMVVTNRLPYTIYLCASRGATCTTDSAPAFPSIAECASATWSMPLQSGERKDVIVGSNVPCMSGTSTAVMSVGDRFVGKIFVPYSVVEDANTGTKARIFEGEVVARVQPS